MSKRKAREAAKMVAVHWTDAAMSVASHWQEGQQPDPPRRKGMHDCITVGWLVHLDDQWCQIVATLTENAHAHVTEIPAGMIKEVMVLEVSGELAVA